MSALLESVGWERSAVCRTRPYDWWNTGDQGNRLAMTLCRLACPVLGECGQADPMPAGVVRAGVTYSDHGVVLTLCPCGRPIIGQSHIQGYCRTCEPPAVRHEVKRQVRSGGRPVEYPCGTWQAYQRHVRKHETTCDPCKEARRLKRREDAAAERVHLATIRADRMRVAA